MNDFIDPATLSPASESEAGSPAPIASGSNPRKRPRSEISSEERKEARAHRNRIAAQNSRDRRKAQFAYLERRVAELEEENRALRAARGVPLLPVTASTAFKAEEEHKRLEASARDRENEELRERIKTLERGWDAVIKALAAQGLPLANPVTPSAPAPAPAPPTTVAPPPVYPISPSPSHSSLDYSASSSSSPSVRPLSTPESSEQQHDTSATAPSTTSPHTTTTTPTSNTNTTEPDDATMENLFMEILAPLPDLASPRPAAATVLRSAAQASGESDTPAEGSTSKVVGAEGERTGLGLRGVEMMDLGTGAAGMGVGVGMDGTGAGVDLGHVLNNEWDAGLEMQRILESLGVPGDYEPQEQQGLSELELDMGWTYNGAESLGVGAF
ncbi:putative bZIP transcription factor [Lyophyllum shimeji]|uniref:X-box-binding protein 1 n=1 Tax=Lyophyllum shimeji TaxID=47721 RepID=A0A9P3PIT0_LYOSH|nr:putative bZIP transcription factor [Lyophyllum shimeji]